MVLFFLTNVIMFMFLTIEGNATGKNFYYIMKRSPMKQWGNIWTSYSKPRFSSIRAAWYLKYQALLRKELALSKAFSRMVSTVLLSFPMNSGIKWFQYCTQMEMEQVGLFVFACICLWSANWFWFSALSNETIIPDFSMLLSHTGFYPNTHSQSKGGQKWQYPALLLL